MIGPELDSDGIANRLFQLYVQRIFSLVAFKKKRMDPANYQYVQFSYFLEELIEQVREKDQEAQKRRMPTFYAIKILDGHYWHAFKEFFEAPIVSADK